MQLTTMVRVLIFGVIVLGFQGCSSIVTKSGEDNTAAIEHTAYTLCGGCHGPKNVRVELMTPKIIGQKQGYLAASLREYRDNKRINPYMNGVVAGLSEQEIDDLAAYFSHYGQSQK